MIAKNYIYRNLHQNTFSIKKRGVVVDRSNLFIADDVTFKVSEKGRQRCILEKRKNVHAYASSDKYIYCKIKPKLDKLHIISYNPYVAAYFTCNDRRIDYAKKVLFCGTKCYLIE